MRLYNQGKNQLGWSMSSESYSCEPWGAVEIPDDLVAAVRSRGLPLDVSPVAPELRAQVRVAEEQAVSQAEPLRLLRKAADDALAAERAAKEELEEKHGELTETKVQLRETREALKAAEEKARRAAADKEAAEKLLSESATQAERSEERAIRAEALLTERKPEPKKKTG